MSISFLLLRCQKKEEEADSGEADNDKRFHSYDYNEDNPFGVEEKTNDGHHDTYEYEGDVDNASNVDPYEYDEDDGDHASDVTVSYFCTTRRKPTTRWWKILIRISNCKMQKKNITT